MTELLLTTPIQSDARWVDPPVVLSDAVAPAWTRRWPFDARVAVQRRPLGDPLTMLRRVAAHAGHRVLLVRDTGGQPETPGTVVAALRDLPTDEAVLVAAAHAARALAADLVVVHAVPRSYGERSVGLSRALAHGQRLLAAAAERAEAAGAPPLTRLVRAWPHELVGEDVDADLLVVGGPRRDARPTEPVGLVARSAALHAPCPVLFVPRPGARL